MMFSNWMLKGDNPISDDRIKFLHRDSENNVWVGTQKGSEPDST